MARARQPDPSRLLAELALDRPLVGFSDAPDPVTVPFGSGRMELVVTSRDLDKAQATIGGTDIAMRGGSLG